MREDYFLASEDEIRDELKRQIYLNSEEANFDSSDEMEKLFVTESPEWKDFVLDPKGKQIEAGEHRKLEEIKRKIMEDVEGLRLGEIESLEEAIDLYWGIFKKHFKKSGPCDGAASITQAILTTKLGYEAKVMKSMIMSHWFVEITDRARKKKWIFDPAAEQVKKFFGD